MLIYEKNDIEINELHRSRGHYNTEPLKDFFSLVVKEVEIKEFTKLVTKYYVGKLGFDDSKISDEKIIQFYTYLDNIGTNSGLRNFLKYDALTGFAYYVANKVFKLKPSGFGLSYFINKNGDTKEFYFFDTAFQIFVGRIEIRKEKLSNIKGNVFDVQTSAAERKLIGMGYGTKMYLTLLENCDYLMSSSVLFSGSYRIWSQILPKYVNVWYKDADSNIKKSKDFKKIDSETPLNIKSDKIDFFVASMYHKKI